MVQVKKVGDGWRGSPGGTYRFTGADSNGSVLKRVGLGGLVSCVQHLPVVCLHGCGKFVCLAFMKHLSCEMAN